MMAQNAHFIWACMHNYRITAKNGDFMISDDSNTAHITFYHCTF